jgi:hypothetical protein
MTIQTKQIITPKTNPLRQDRLSEIAEILLNGIRRLEERKKTENPQILLDSKSFQSLHSTDSKSY